MSHPFPGQSPFDPKKQPPAEPPPPTQAPTRTSWKPVVITAIVVMVLIGLLASLGVFIFSSLGSSRSLLGDHASSPDTHRTIPSDAWNAGFESAWKMDGAFGPFVSDDTLFVTRLSEATTPEQPQLTLLAYDISGAGEPQELWRTDIPAVSLDVSYVRDGALHGLVVIGNTFKRVTIDLTSHEMQTFDLPLGDDGQPLQIVSFGPDFYMACSFVPFIEYSGELTRSRLNLILNLGRQRDDTSTTLGVSCSAYTYDDTRLWVLPADSRLELPGLNTVNVESGKLVHLQPTAIAPEDTGHPLLISMPGDTQVEASVAYGVRGIQVWNLDGTPAESYPVPKNADWSNDEGVVFLESVIRQIPQAQRTQFFENVASTGFRAADGYTALVFYHNVGLGIRYPNGERSRVAGSGLGFDFVSSPDGDVTIVYSDSTVVKLRTESHEDPKLETSETHTPFTRNLMARPDLLITSTSDGIVAYSPRQK